MLICQAERIQAFGTSPSAMIRSVGVRRFINDVLLSNVTYDGRYNRVRAARSSNSLKVYPALSPLYADPRPRLHCLAVNIQCLSHAFSKSLAPCLPFHRQILPGFNPPPSRPPISTELLLHNLCTSVTLCMGK
jgi:hypothetical protein